MENSIRAISPLNEDIYISLYKYLNLQTQINLSQTSTFLKDVFVKNVCEKMPKELHMKSFLEIRKLSDNDMKYFWQHYGSRLEDIIMEGEAANRHINFTPIQYDAMRQYCVNLKSLKLTCVPNIEFTNFFNATNLQTITEVFFNCERLDDDQLEPLTKLENLEKIGLWHALITGKHIDRMSKVKHLTLRYCRNISMEDMFNICKTLDLRYLDVRDINVKNLNGIMAYCGELEELKLSWDGFTCSLNHFNIPTLPKLKSLTISQRDFISYMLMQWDRFFNALAAHYKNTLQELTLCLFTADQTVVDDDESPVAEQIEDLQKLFRKLFYPKIPAGDSKNSILKFKVGPIGDL